MEQDFETRKKEFLEGFGKLREEYQCDFFSVPSYVPSQEGFWQLVVQPQVADLKQMLTPSPIIVSE